MFSFPNLGQVLELLACRNHFWPGGSGDNLSLLARVRIPLLFMVYDWII